MIGKTSTGFFVFTRYFGMEVDGTKFAYLTAATKGKVQRLGKSRQAYLGPLYVRIGRF